MDEQVIEQKINELETLYASVKNLRMDLELKYYDDEIAKTSPRLIGRDENIFSKLGKNITNNVNSSRYNKIKEKQLTLRDLHKELKETYNIYSNEEFKTKLQDMFETDDSGIAKLEFSMSVILDSTFDYETNKESFRQISLLLNENENYLLDLKVKMLKAYQDISLDKTDNFKNALIVGGALSLLLVTGGVGGVFAGYAAGLTSLGIGMTSTLAVIALTSAVSMAGISYVTYSSLNANDKRKLKEEFAKYTVEETTMSLVKTSMCLLYLKENNKKEQYEDLYDSFVEQYIDLKSDVDLRLFKDNDDVELNKKKNKLFNNADAFLRNNLFTE